MMHTAKSDQLISWLSELAPSLANCILLLAACMSHLVPGVSLPVGLHMVMQPHCFSNIVQGLGPALKKGKVDVTTASECQVAAT